MSESDAAVGASGHELRKAARPTIDEFDGGPQPSEPNDDQTSDSKSNPVSSTDQQQSYLRQHLLEMARTESVGNLETLRKLIKKYNLEVNVKDEDSGMTPLHIAAKGGLVGAVEELLRAGAELGTQDHACRTPLMTATEYRQEDVMERLLSPRPESADLKSQLETRNKLGVTPLLSATIDGFPEGVKLLINAGADCNAQTHPFNATPLIVAGSLGYQAIAVMLLDTRNSERCADLNLQDDDGDTALTSAVIGGHYEIAKSLLDANADFTIKNHQKKELFAFSK
ncbi:hypothetical protein CPAR01_05522 [Colletotrichum paranaense]|uniref:Ankyrin repeat protein n=1 Tax=Colletotrichum paranaense TaxID=1914294 RepID=A0ABQ9SS27_9PEZI|nr:uncharacterized protein CPAR01_05522 [Colletotrichum paranaense]KAK1542135.1 hypothetical protein CPAR01_05522 [Colletotrichum paranaense]